MKQQVQRIGAAAAFVHLPRRQRGVGVDAIEVIAQVEPRLIVPMHYATDVSKPELDGVDRFMREMGLTAPAPQSRLNITASSLPAEPTVALLEHRG
mgnify:CR=1 FL=1